MSEPRAAHRLAVWVTSLHTGGCSACAQCLAALEAPRYAGRLAELGVTFTRLPQHSDIILLCGALTEQARASVSALIAGTPRPRALVAVGDCAVNGCVFAGSPHLTVPLAQALHVNVEIGGCPPAPPAIIEAIAEAKRLLSARAAKPSWAAEPSASARAARLAMLIEAAGSSWDKYDELSIVTATDQKMIEREHLAGTGNGASAPGARQQEEKRR